MNTMNTNSTRTIDDVRMMLFTCPCAVVDCCAGASPACAEPQPGSGSVERADTRITVPTARAMPPESMPAVGVIAEASAMEIDGLNMKPMSSSTPS